MHLPANRRGNSAVFPERNKKATPPICRVIKEHTRVKEVLRIPQEASSSSDSNCYDTFVLPPDQDSDSEHIEAIVVNPFDYHQFRELIQEINESLWQISPEQQVPAALACLNLIKHYK